MSGGHYDYLQYRITEITDSIEQAVRDSGTKKPKNELYNNDDFYEKYPEELNYYKYPDHVIKEFKNGIKLLEKAQVYAQRIDWLLSGDDGEDSFIERLEEDLGKLER